MILGWSCLAETYLAFGRLHETVMTGRSGFELAFGTSFTSHLHEHPDRGAAYDAAMASTAEGFESAVAAFDFSPMRMVVDVGAGGGALLTCLLRRHPDMRGVLYDVPQVIDRISLPPDVAPRVELVAGDALQSVPAGADGYILSTVLRCFDDAGARRILAMCRKAMTPAARLLALEMVTPPGPPQPLLGLADLQALMLYGGGDRDEQAWARLLAGASLKLEQIEDAGTPFSWVVATAA
jgi:hypothetical protein